MCIRDSSFATQQLYGGTTLGAGGCAKTGSCTQPLLVPLSNYWLNQLVDSDGGKLVDNADLVSCLLYTSDAADEEDSVDLGGRRIIKKKRKISKISITKRTYICNYGHIFFPCNTDYYFS